LSSSGQIKIARQQFADSFNIIPWEYFVTITYAKKPTLDWADNKGWPIFCNIIRDQLPHRHRFDFIRATEQHKSGYPHHHALITGVGPTLNCDKIQRKCFTALGRMNIQPFILNGGALRYCFKRLGEGSYLTVSRSIKKRIVGSPQAGS